MGSVAPGSLIEPAAALHEVVLGSVGATSPAIGFGLALATMAARSRGMAWLRHGLFDLDHGKLDGSGLLAFGVPPERTLVVTLRRVEHLLWAAVEAARCPGLGAVLVELRDDGRAVGFTATRRLALAAKTSGVTVVLVRATVSAEPTAAAMRWAVAPAPSTPLEAGAPGRPAFLATLMRHRGGIPGATLRVEWSRDQRSLVVAPLLGAVVPPAADRPAQGVVGPCVAPERRRAG